MYRVLKNNHFYTTEMVSEAVCNLYDYRLEEKEQGLMCNGVIMVPRVMHVYIPDPKLLAENYRREPKQLNIPAASLCRRGGELWQFVEGRTCIVPEVGEVIEILILRDQHAALEHYVVTDEDHEDPVPAEFSYIETPDGKITLTGVTNYCECLTIPSMFHEKTVAAASIPYSLNIDNLRKLTVEPGVRTIHFCWGLPRLEELSLPEGLCIAYDPWQIRFSQWFRDQPDGAIYLGNWYCGTKGDVPEDGTLRLREGTIGITRNANLTTAHWKKVILPKSLTYIGNGSFLRSMRYPAPRVVCPPGKEVFIGAFDPWDQLMQDESKPESERKLTPGCMTAQELYSLVPNPAVPHFPPVLRCRNGHLTATFHYVPRGDGVAGIITAELPSGKISEKRMRTVHVLPEGISTEDHRPGAYLLAEGYMNSLVEMLNRGNPSQEELECHRRWWEDLWEQVFHKGIAIL